MLLHPPRLVAWCGCVCVCLLLFVLLLLYMCAFAHVRLCVWLVVFVSGVSVRVLVVEHASFVRCAAAAARSRRPSHPPPS